MRAISNDHFTSTPAAVFCAKAVVVSLTNHRAQLRRKGPALAMDKMDELKSATLSKSHNEHHKVLI
jgi:hypothetical protein